MQAEVCNFSRDKLHHRHFPRKVLKAKTAFLFALFQSFWWAPWKWLLYSSFFQSLEEVLNNFRRNEFLYTDTFFETFWRQTSWNLEKFWEMTAVKFFSKRLQADFSLTFPELVHGLRRGHFPGKVLKEKTTYFILFLNLPK